MFEAILEARPDQPAGLIGLARCAQLQSEWSVAADLWKAACDSFPSDERRENWQRRYVNSLVLAERKEEARGEIKAHWESSPQRRAYRDATTNVADGTHEQVRFDHVLIVTYGRSGSTILQGVLNSINGLLVRGENGNVFHDFFTMTRGLGVHRGRSANSFAPNSAWFGIAEMTSDRMVAELRPVARRMLLGDDVDDPAITSIGFKEIRYLDVMDDLVDYLQFLEQLFPNAAFVLNTRDPNETAKSGWWRAEDPEQLAQEIGRLESRFAEFAGGRSNCFEIDYRDVVGKGENLRRLFHFLGAEFDEQKVDAVLAISHSYQPGDRRDPLMDLS